MELTDKFCSRCGKQQIKNNKHFFIICGLILFIILVSIPSFLFLTGSDLRHSNPQTSKSITDTKKTPNIDIEKEKKAKNDNWSYQTVKDELRNNNYNFAINTSLNKVDLGFPYDNSQLKIVLRKHGEDKNIMLSLEKGQFSCFGNEEGACFFSVKFDDDIVYKNEFVKTEDLSTNLVFVFDPEPFLEKLMNSKKAIIEIDAYNGGKPQYHFDLRNLKWEY